MPKLYSYPRLSSTDLGFFRLGGAGLANCMFFAAKAYLHSRRNGTTLVNPTWEKFSPGTYIRHERDKRHYTSLFKTQGVSGLRKVGFLLGWKLHLIKHTHTFNSLGNYFGDLAPEAEAVREYFHEIANPKALAQLEGVDLSDAVGIHVRLGDYVAQWRVPIEWYCGVAKEIARLNPSQKFIVFSDGTDEELAPLLAQPNVERRFFGNALADMFALSRCKLVVASDSTFSAWGAFLGNVPLLFHRRHFPPVHCGNAPEIILGEGTSLPDEIGALFEKH